MTALTATAQPDGSVRLTITAAPAGDVALARGDANGLDTVRRTSSANLTTGDTRTLLDWEAALSGQVRYSLVDAAGVTAYATATFDGLAVGPQLRATYKPDRYAPLVLADLGATRTLRYTQHQVVGRSDDVFTTYRLGLRAGVITLRCEDLPAAAAIAQVYGDGQPALLRSPDHRGLDMHHLALGVTPVAQEVLADGTQVWAVTIQYAEVKPAAVNSLVGWTCDDLMAAYATSAMVSIAYPTAGALLSNVVGA